MSPTKTNKRKGLRDQTGKRSPPFAYEEMVEDVNEEEERKSIRLNPC